MPAIRACIFDMDGLLIDSEDVLTASVNQVLERHGRPPFTPSIRAQLMGIPDSTNSDVFHEWATLPISREQFALEASAQMKLNFPSCKPLPGAERLLSHLSTARSASSGEDIRLALASTTKKHSYELKTSSPETNRLLSFFQPDCRILGGDDPRVGKGRQKPAPDVYLVALGALNSASDSSERPIATEECLVFEDSVAGVEAARRAGMRVVWVPHPDIAIGHQTQLTQVLAGRTGLFSLQDEWQLGQIDDGKGESIASLSDFDYDKYGIQVQRV